MNGFLNPTEVLKQIKLNKDMIAADFGCGSGGWVIPLAKILEDGKVYAIDVLKEPLSVLKGKIHSESISNIEILESDVEIENGLNIPDAVCDIVLMTNLLFECEYKERVIREASRTLKDKGKILVVDWTANTIFGPKEGKVSAQEVKKIAKGIGLKLEKEFLAGNYHYALIFSK
ncbi:MAG: class I SAM-dependent methyltransferase [Patescibacteria group bacterium]|nr:class I SAM-dependent methyltransferase [Patescibacteria group bacterium]